MLNVFLTTILGLTGLVLIVSTILESLRRPAWSGASRSQVALAEQPAADAEVQRVLTAASPVQEYPLQEVRSAEEECGEEAA